MATTEVITTGARFGRWTVVQEAESKIYSTSATRRDMYLCRCDCSHERSVCGRSLITGMSTSCGCSRDLRRRMAYIAPGMKRCNRCKQVLPLSAFGKRPERGPEAVRPKCNECGRELRRVARARETPVEKKRAAELHKVWMQADRARPALLALEAELEERRVYSRDYYRRTPGKGAAKTKRYLTQKACALPVWADLVVISKIYRRCAKLNRKRAGSGKWLVVDHIIPLQSKLVCGLHVHNNLRIISNVSNIRKGNRHWPDMPEDPKTPGKRKCIGCQCLLSTRKFEGGRKKCRRCRYGEFRAARIAGVIDN